MAIASALVDGRCFHDVDLAVDHYWGTRSPEITSGSTVYYSLTEKKLGGQWYIDNYRIDEFGTAILVTSSPVPAITFPPCDPTEYFFDGVAIGWGLGAVLVAVSAFLLMRKAAR